MGFEMPGNGDFCLLGKQQGHLWVYWLHPLTFVKHYESTIFPPLFTVLLESQSYFQFHRFNYLLQI